VPARDEGLALITERAAAQLLSGLPTTSATDVVERILAVQAQDGRGARLAIRARSQGLTAADVDRCLTEDRSLVVSWLNRGTLHLVRAEDYWWLHQLTAPTTRASNARRLQQEGLPAATAATGVDVVVAALKSEGPLTRGALRERLTAAGIRTEGQAMIHVLLLASLDGLIVRGPMATPTEQAFALVTDWLGDPPAELDRDEALARLARRYLAGHGPATDRDLATWAKITLGDARRGIAAIDRELRTRADEFLQLEESAAAQPLPRPRLLGQFEPLLHGWTDRTSITGDRPGLITINGIFRAFAFVNGRAVAVWRLSGGMLSIEPFGRLTRADRLALEDDAKDVLRFLGPDGQAGKDS
jgi:hypothetical protein